MSASLIRQLLETALATITPALSTAYENNKFVPVAGTAYQQVNLLFAEPVNPELHNKSSNGFYVEQGIFQVTLKYPIETGPAALTARAELIRALFYRGATFTGTKTTVTVERTPTISPGMVDGDRWSVPVKIRFSANCFN